MEYMIWLQNIRQSLGSFSTTFWMKVTAFGQPLITFMLLATVYWCISKKAGQFIAWNVAIGCVLNQCLKNIYKIERPWIRDSRIIPAKEAATGATGSSFPSGHTTRAMAVWGTFGYWYKKKRSQIWCLGYVVVFLVALSRLFLGVHTIWDVLGSVVVGMITLIVVNELMLWTGRNIGRKCFLALVVLVVMIIITLATRISENTGSAIGLILGYMLETMFVKFKPNGSVGIRVIRLIVGQAGLIFVLFCLTGFGGFIYNFIIGFYIMFLYPAIFKKMGL